MSDLSSFAKAPAPATRALIELLDHWDAGPVPEAWIAKHCADGTLATVWANAPSAIWLLLVRAVLGDRAGFIRGLGAAARVAIDLSPEPVDVQARALDAIDAWARGDATRDDAITGSDDNADLTWKAKGISQRVASVVDHVVQAIVRPELPAASSIEGVFGAMRELVKSLGPDDDMDARLARWRSTTEAMTKRVREIAAPPSLDQIRACAGEKNLRKTGAGILVRVSQA